MKIQKSKNKNQMNLFVKSASLFALLFALTFTTSCNKGSEGEDPILVEISEEDAVDVLEGALTNDTEGLVTEIEDASEIADQYAEKTILTDPCGVTFDSTYMASGSNSFGSADYANTLEWTVNCTSANIPSDLVYSRETQGSYESVRMTSTDASTGAWTVDNLILGTTYVINGTYTREGNQTSKVRNENALTSTITMDITNMDINKGTRRIESGTADVTVAGTSSTGQAFAFSGEIIFQGNGSVVVVINGNSYTIDLY